MQSHVSGVTNRNELCSQPAFRQNSASGIRDSHESTQEPTEETELTNLFLVQEERSFNSSYTTAGFHKETAAHPSHWN